jgi:hypothetical protein
MEGPGTTTPDDEATLSPSDGVDLETAATVVPAPRPRATGPMHEGAPIGIAIGVVSAFAFASLSFLVAFAFFAAVAIYALVKAIGDGGSGNPVVIALTTVMLLTTFVALLLVGMGKLGGSLTPKKRAKEKERRSRG